MDGRELVEGEADRRGMVWEDQVQVGVVVWEGIGMSVRVGVRKDWGKNKVRGKRGCEDEVKVDNLRIKMRG